MNIKYVCAICAEYLKGRYYYVGYQKTKRCKELWYCVDCFVRHRIGVKGEKKNVRDPSP